MSAPPSGSKGEPGGNPFAARLLLLLGALLLGWSPAWGSQTPGSDCTPSAQLRFICGSEHPEDLAQIPGSDWLIASGFSPGAGLKLVNVRQQTLRRWYSGSADEIGHDASAYPRCPGPPNPALLTTRGLSLRARAHGRFRLYAVNHGGRESIEVFNVALRNGEPHLRWIGCLPMPPNHVANAVATWADGTVLATVLTRPGTSIADFVRGYPTGGVYEWRPGDTQFRLLRGTELPGNNGLETSRDDRHFYVVAFGWHAILVYSRTDSSHPIRTMIAPGFMPDNIHWSNGRLITAGMRYDEPACGGLRRIVDGIADPMTCHRGYVVAQLDPRTLSFRTILEAGPDRDFNGVSAASIVNGTLWLGSYQSDRIAYRPMPRR
jgi:hypothetical protein